MTKTEFKTLFDTYFDAIRGYLYYRSGNMELATDIAQDVFMKVWEKQFDVSTPKIKGLLYKIAMDIFISKYRKVKVEQNYTNSLSFEFDDLSPDKEIEYNELKGKYERALVKLPDKQREVFLMSRIDKLKYSEIAERLRISNKAVEKRMSKAIAFLKSVLIEN